MFGFIEKMFIGLLSPFTTRKFGESLGSNCVKCVSLNNPSCQARPTRVNINFN